MTAQAPAPQSQPQISIAEPFVKPLLLEMRFNGQALAESDHGFVSKTAAIQQLVSAIV